MQYTHLYTIEAEARFKSKQNNSTEVFMRWLTDHAGEFIIKKTFHAGKLIQHGIYEINKITRL